MSHELSISETRKACECFKQLAGAELQTAISLIFKDLPEGKSPRKYAMPSVQRGKIYTIDFNELSRNSVILLINYFDGRANRLALPLPFEGKYANMKGLLQQNNRTGNKSNKQQQQNVNIQNVKSSPPSKRELENELSGLSALTGIKAVDLTKTSPQQLVNDGQISLGKRPREESPTDNNTNSSQPPNTKCLTIASIK